MMRRARSRAQRLIGLAAVATVAIAGPAEGRSTSFLSHNAGGHAYDAPVTGYAVSQDQRHTRFFALVSRAGNVVAGRGGLHTDIFVVQRSGPAGNDGSPWLPGPTIAPIRARGGGRPNGDSYAPALDGGFYAPARCLAFVSQATNLVGGPRGRGAQAYVEDLVTRRITRVSVSSSGRPANGPVSAVAIDGSCSRVAFVAAATNLAGVGGVPAASGVRGRPSSTPQAYVHVFAAAGFPAAEMNSGLVGTTFLASAGAGGRPANRAVSDLALANFGQNLAFSTEATDLVPGAHGRQVYEVSLGYGYGPLQGHRLAPIHRAVRLVSATPTGRPGNGPSTHPAMAADGAYVSYATEASNLLPGDADGVSDVARAALFRRPLHQEWVSGPRGADGAAPDGPSQSPTSTWGAFIVEYESGASNLAADVSRRRLAPGLTPGPGPSVLSWNDTQRSSRLESRDPADDPFSLPSTNPRTSYFGNYTLFSVIGQVWLRYAPK